MTEPNREAREAADWLKTERGIVASEAACSTAAAVLGFISGHSAATASAEAKMIPVVEKLGNALLLALSLLGNPVHASEIPLHVEIDEALVVAGFLEKGPELVIVHPENAAPLLSALAEKAEGNE